MNTRKLEALKKQILPILKQAGVKRAAIFGSIARGEDTKKSDVDIFITVPHHMGLFDFIGLQHRLEDALQKKVDLVDYDGIKPRLKPYIVKDEVAIL